MPSYSDTDAAVLIFHHSKVNALQKKKGKKGTRNEPAEKKPLEAAANAKTLK